MVLQLINLKSPTNNKIELHFFKTEFERIIKTLNNYKPEIIECSWFVAIMLQNKLPAEVDKFIFQFNKTKYFDLEQISKGLTDYVEFLTRSENDNKMYKPVVEETIKSVSKSYIGK